MMMAAVFSSRRFSHNTLRAAFACSRSHRSLGPVVVSRRRVVNVVSIRVFQQHSHSQFPCRALSSQSFSDSQQSGSADVENLGPLGESHECASGSDFIFRPVTVAQLQTVLVSDAKKLVVLMCCTKSCGPCKKFEPTFALFAESNKENALFVKINADEGEDEFKALCSDLNVRDVPAFRLFRGGDEIKEPQLRLCAPGLKNVEKTLRSAIHAHI
mmetsp:Transcript_8279/g.18779  ORF Transcript_8279/g.18779 Transcript_8279/m.18779 type:complete len:214 (-) Transcript_8279:235-876(-)